MKNKIIASCVFIIALIILSGCLGTGISPVEELRETTNETLITGKSTLKSDSEASVLVIDISTEIQALETFLKEVNEVLS